MYRAFREELEAILKVADVKTKLLPHQQRVIDRIQAEDQPGLVVVHGLGSGKTLTSIAAQDALGMGATAVVPAALQANYLKEREKHLGSDGQPITLETLQRTARQGRATENPLLIVDEAHRARETNTKTYKALKQTPSEKRLLLTGSPFYNRPSDIAPLINLAAGENILPGDSSSFAQRYVSEQAVKPGFIDRVFRGIQPGTREVLNPRTAPELQKSFQKWVDYHPGSTENFPKVTREDVKVPMTPEQLAIYDATMGQAPAWVRRKVLAGLPPSKQESKDLNAFMSAVRQISNTTAGFQPGKAQDPKIDTAFKKLQEHLAQNENAKAVVYSNFLESGINPYKQRLQAAGIPFGEFTGEMNKKDRDHLVNQYNENKIKALLLSSAGGEGLDLKGTRLMQVLDPHWNNEKLRQVEGRGIRFKSHEHLPEAERNITVQRFLATRPRSGIMEKLHLSKPGGSSDEYLSMLSQDKDKLNDQFRSLLPKSGANHA